MEKVTFNKKRPEVVVKISSGEKFVIKTAINDEAWISVVDNVLDYEEATERSSAGGEAATDCEEQYRILYSMIKLEETRELGIVLLRGLIERITGQHI